VDAAVRPPLLLACDDQPLAGLLLDLLGDHGYQTAWCRTGQELLTSMRHHPARCVVLLSLRWPPLHSCAVLQAVASDEWLQRRHACVLLTALWDCLTAEDRAVLQALGVPLVPKPFALDTVLTAVAEAAARVSHEEGSPAPA
jgi:CheY-like chemotaxis protein